MRSIKFRAWDKKNNCWYSPVFEAYKVNLYDLSDWDSEENVLSGIFQAGTYQIEVIGNIYKNYELLK